MDKVHCSPRKYRGEENSEANSWCCHLLSGFFSIVLSEYESLRLFYEASFYY